MIRILLFSSNSFDTGANKNVLNPTIEYIFYTKRFDELLFQWKQKIFKQYYESVHSAFIVFTCIICKFLFHFLRICFIPRYPHSFRYLVILSFNFTAYDVIYKKKKKRKALEFREDKKMSTDCLMDLAEYVLKNNISEHNFFFKKIKRNSHRN